MSAHRAGQPDPLLAVTGVLPKQPALTTASGIILGTLVIDVVLAFGVPLTPDVKALIIGAVSLLAPFVQALIVRTKVFSPHTVAELQRIYSQLLEAAQPGMLTIPQAAVAPDNPEVT